MDVMTGGNGTDGPTDEIVIVDDGSTDHTKEVCASFGDKLRYIYQPNYGSFGVGSRTVAMRAARG